MAAEFAGVWEYDTALAMADPGAGKLRTSAADDAIAISATDRNGLDLHAELAGLEPRATVLCQERADATLAANYELAVAAIDHGAWIELRVALLAASAGITGPPTKNADVLVVASPPVAPPPPYPGLPDPIIDPGLVSEVVAGTTPEQAMLCAQLATLAVQTAIWPAVVADPAPLPIQTCTLSIACRLAVAGAGTEEAAGGRVVSESLGAYSYRLADAPGIGAGLELTATERRLLSPWLRPGSAYELNTGGAIHLPWDWWQRDLDQPNDYPPGLPLAAEAPA